MSKSPVDALDDFLEVLRREFESDPDLAHRVVKALGAKVELRGSKAADVLNPLELVDRDGVESAKQTLQTFSLAELKKIAKNHQLATPVDTKSMDEVQLIDVIIRRASNKISERR